MLLRDNAWFGSFNDNYVSKSEANRELIGTITGI